MRPFIKVSGGSHRAEWWVGADEAAMPGSPESGSSAFSYLDICPGWRGQEDELCRAWVGTYGGLSSHPPHHTTALGCFGEWKGGEGQILDPHNRCKRSKSRRLVILLTPSWGGDQPKLSNPLLPSHWTPPPPCRGDQDTKGTQNTSLLQKQGTSAAEETPEREYDQVLSQSQEKVWGPPQSLCEWCRVSPAQDTPSSPHRDLGPPARYHPGTGLTTTGHRALPSPHRHPCYQHSLSARDAPGTVFLPSCLDFVSSVASKTYRLSFQPSRFHRGPSHYSPSFWVKFHPFQLYELIFSDPFPTFRWPTQPSTRATHTVSVISPRGE